MAQEKRADKHKGQHRMDKKAIEKGTSKAGRKGQKGTRERHKRGRQTGTKEGTEHTQRQ